jgi:hypothetical protein
MACEHWKTDWVARVYDELDAEELRGMDAHLERCADCRATLDRLVSSRRLLHEASPRVPASPGVVVLEPRSSLPALWSFAAGAACALIVFGAAVALGPRLVRAPVEASGPPTLPAAVPGDQALRELREDVRAFEARLALLESPREGRDGVLTEAQLQATLEQLERRFDRARSQDLDYLMRSITASEMRTGQWLDQTHDALNLLALRQDPRVSEQ